MAVISATLNGGLNALLGTQICKEQLLAVDIILFNYLLFTAVYSKLLQIYQPLQITKSNWDLLLSRAPTKNVG